MDKYPEEVRAQLNQLKHTVPAHRLGMFADVSVLMDTHRCVCSDIYVCGNVMMCLSCNVHCAIIRYHYVYIVHTFHLLGTESEVSAAITFLLSPAAAFISGTFMIYIIHATVCPLTFLLCVVGRVYPTGGRSGS